MTAKAKIGGAAAASLAAVICGTVGTNYVGTGGSDSVSVTYDQLVISSYSQTEQTSLSENTVEITVYSSSAEMTSQPPHTVCATSATTSIATTSASAAATTALSEPVTIEDEITVIVYVSKTGKYHRNNDCSGMKYYTEMSLDEAIDAGHAACKRCW